MGTSLSVYRHFPHFFRRKDNHSPVPSETDASEWQHVSQRPPSSTHSIQGEASKTIYSDYHHSFHSLSYAENNYDQTDTTNKKLAEAGPALMPHPCGTALPTALPPTVPLFALVIGIDRYLNCRGLRGAVADAKATVDYLEETLGVPDSHTHILLDDQATRNAIIDAFKDLRNDSRIQKGDPILVYYAGHGGELPMPHGWGSSTVIQCLLPYDYNSTNVYPIPDRTIGALIEDIAIAKGNNITVILDCCYSAGCVRDENEEYIPRTVNLDSDIPEILDDDILGGRAGVIADSFAHYGLQSHVLLAACGQDELAYERNGRGQFTDAVLTVLKASVLNDLTYAQVIERIHLPNQNPQCEGLDRHRNLFDLRVSVVKQVCHTVRTDESGSYVIGAGLAHGVSPGAMFTLHSDPELRLDALVVDDATAIGDFETAVTIPGKYRRNASYAKLTCIGKVTMPIYLDQGDAAPILRDTLRRLAECGSTNSAFRFVEDPQEAKLEVKMEKDLVVFCVADPRVKRFGLGKLPFATTLGTAARVLDAAARYYWYLDLTNKVHFSVGTVCSQVAIDFHLLEQDCDEYGLPFYIPVTPGLCRKDLDGSNVVDFIVNPSALYGIEIKNNTQHDLYLNAFLFNCSSFSIVPYYTQSSAGNPEAPLKRNGTFTIGYGPGGTPPFAYWLAENQEVDVGYLKVFFATRPIDLSDVVQSSPFVNTKMTSASEARHPCPDDTDARKAKLSVSPAGQGTQGMPEDTWFTVDVPIVQRRRISTHH